MAPSRDKSKDKSKDKAKEKTSTSSRTRIGLNSEPGSSNRTPSTSAVDEDQSHHGQEPNPVDDGQNNDHSEQTESHEPINFNESLQRYITNIANATIGLSRAEDLRTRQAEYEVERTKMREEIVNTIRDTLRAATPAPRSRPFPDLSHPENHSTVRPGRSSDENLEHPHLSENAENFLSQLNNLNLNAPTPSPGNALSSHGSFRAVAFHKWGLKFDNVRMTIDDFLIRLKRLKTSYNASWEEIFLHFHLFVTGPVESWFWTFLKTNPDANWQSLEFALIEQYRSIETDSELSRKMFDRRQGPNESFDEFYNAILIMNARLHSPKSRKELIDLIKQNVRRRTGELLITFSTQSLAEMVYVCRSIEKHAQTQNENFRQKPFLQNSIKKQVSEIETVSEEAFEIDALNISNSNLAKYTCWNCKNKGHSFVQCPDPQRNLFCYKCGLENVTTPNCSHCSGKPKQGNTTTGAFCPARTHPDPK